MTFLAVFVQKEQESFVKDTLNKYKIPFEFGFINNEPASYPNALYALTHKEYKNKISGTYKKVLSTLNFPANTLSIYFPPISATKYIAALAIGKYAVLASTNIGDMLDEEVITDIYRHLILQEPSARLFTDLVYHLRKDGYISKTSRTLIKVDENLLNDLAKYNLTLPEARVKYFNTQNNDDGWFDTIEQDEEARLKYFNTNNDDLFDTIPEQDEDTASKNLNSFEQSMISLQDSIKNLGNSTDSQEMIEHEVIQEENTVTDDLFENKQDTPNSFDHIKTSLENERIYQALERMEKKLEDNKNLITIETALDLIIQHQVTKKDIQDALIENEPYKQELIKLLPIISKLNPNQISKLHNMIVDFILEPEN